MIIRRVALAAAAIAAAALLTAWGCESDGGAANGNPGGGGAPDGGAAGGAAGHAGGAIPYDAGPANTCGNGRLDSLEACDGALFSATLTSCDDNNLGSGTVVCTARCGLDFSGCSEHDYCQGLGFYGDGQCDACELMGGQPDPDCAAHCGADGVCASWYDSAVAAWSCPAAGWGDDPDCGGCGDGVVQGHEFCDGNAFANLGGQPLDSCEVWSYSGGTLGCHPDCTPDFSGCQP
jgi:hypothetical protein